MVSRRKKGKAIHRSRPWVCVCTSLTQMTCVKRIPGEKGKSWRFIYPDYRFFLHTFFTLSLTHLMLSHHHRPPSITSACDAIRAIHTIKFCCCCAVSLSLKKYQKKKLAFVFVFGLWWIWASIHSLHKHKREFGITLSSPLSAPLPDLRALLLASTHLHIKIFFLFEAHAHV